MWMLVNSVFITDGIHSTIFFLYYICLYVQKLDQYNWSGHRATANLYNWKITTPSGCGIMNMTEWKHDYTVCILGTEAMLFVE